MRFDVTRRAGLLGLGALGLAACARRKARPYEISQQIRYQIDQLVFGGEVPAAGLIVRRAGTTIFEHSAGFASGLEDPGALPRAFTSGTKFRAASQSKLATALLAHRLAQAGKLDLSADVARYFSKPLRHPAFADVPITLARLLSHTSGLQDPEIYWMAAPGAISDLFTDRMWRDAKFGPPGKGFLYANFGYGLIATVIEAVMGERFDRLATQHVFEPLRIDAGFNWSGVSQAVREKGASLYRRSGGAWRAETDAGDVLAGTAPTILAADGFALEAYKPGTNGTLFSPQGGLRASLADLATLVRAVASIANAAAPVWTFSDVSPNGETDFGYFRSYGLGPQIHSADDSPMPGEMLIGHHGEAYGLYGGAWHIPARDMEFAYVVTGSPEGEAERSGLHPAANIYTAPLFMAAAQALAL